MTHTIFPSIQIWFHSYIKGPIDIRILLECCMQVIHQIWCQKIQNVKFQFIFLLGYAHKTSQLIKWCGTRARLLRFCRPLIGTNSTPTQHKSLKFTRKKNITQRSFYHYEENNIISCWRRRFFTVWKFQEFSVIKILDEINCGEFRTPKTPFLQF